MSGRDVIGPTRATLVALRLPGLFALAGHGVGERPEKPLHVSAYLLDGSHLSGEMPDGV